jgi:membrane protein
VLGLASFHGSDDEARDTMAVKDRLHGMPVIGTALRVQDRYKADAGDQFAGAIGFFGFLSLFPLLILALSVVGFVFADASDARITEVAGTIQRAIPGFAGVLGGGEDGTSVAEALDTIIRNRGTVGLVGLVMLLLSGLRLVNAAQTATLVIFGADLLTLSGAKRKLQQLAALTVLGVLALVGVVTASTLGVVTRLDVLGPMRILAPLLTWAGTLVADVLLFLVAYRLFASRTGPTWRQHLPGAILAGFGWTLLKGFGATYVSRQVASAGELYGTLGGVIGLLLLLYLAGRLYVYGAALSAVKLEAPGGSGSGRAPDAADAVEVTDSTEVQPEAHQPASSVATASSFAARRPSDPGSDGASPAVSPVTRSRLDAIPPAPRGGQSRQALGFALGVGALAGLVAALRPWDTD